MNGIHDLGGRDGIGAVAPPPPDAEPVWKAEWEKAAHAMFPLAFRAGYFGLDEFRYAMEQMEPVEYLTSAYYEHWLHAVEHYGVRAGAFDPDDIDRRAQYYLENPDAPLPDAQDPDLVAFIDGVVAAGATASRDTGRPASFAVGDRVTVIADAPRGHTRKASYVRGKTGVIELAHGEMIYPDSAGNGHGEGPEHVYTVLFTNSELWGAEAAEPNGSVTFDVWEPYIVPAASGTTTEESAA